MRCKIIDTNGNCLINYFPNLEWKMGVAELEDPFSFMKEHSHIIIPANFNPPYAWVVDFDCDKTICDCELELYTDWRE